MARTILLMAACAAFAGVAQAQTTITVRPAKARQTFDGLGVGAIFYEGHLTSLAARGKNERQQQIYDDMFARVPTRYLQLMIRETHEPRNDNGDPYTPAFDDKDFEYCKHTIEIARAALKRQPDIQFLATLYTPPPWMKTNNAASGGGESRATLKDGMELELGEYLWAFVAHLHKNDVPIHYLSIANEPDWPHTQPGYFLNAKRHAALFKTVGVTGRAAVKATAFRAADERTLIVHVVNAQDADATVALKLTGKFAAAASAARSRTSAKEDAQALEALTGKAGAFSDTLPGRSMVTYRFEGAGK